MISSCRMKIKFPISCVTDTSYRSIYNDSNGIRNVVIDMKERNGEDTQLEDVCSLCDFDVQLTCMKIFLSTFNNGCRHGKGIDRRIANIWNRMRNSSDMVIVTMSDDNASDVFFFSFEVAHVWNDVIYSRHSFFRKLKSHIDKDDVVFVFDERT